LDTSFDHPYLAVALDDLSLDLTNVLVDQSRNLTLPAKDFFAGLDHAVRAQRIRLSRKTECRFRLLPRFEKRLVRPLRRKRRIRFELVYGLDRVESAFGDV